jgi:hypothetical protein
MPGFQMTVSVLVMYAFMYIITYDPRLAKKSTTGLPDSYWYNIPKRKNIPNDHEIYQMATKLTKWPKIDQMATKLTKWPKVDKMAKN